MPRTRELHQQGGPVAALARGGFDPAITELRMRASDAKRRARLIVKHGIATIREPRLLVARRQYLFLLSHMRCYTTVLGHILGGHEEIAGSYEVHQSYTSGWDLIRLRYVTYYMHTRKFAKKYFFDKILHDSHVVSPAILNRNDVRVLFSLRDPADAIRSMIHVSLNYTDHPDKRPEYPDTYRLGEYYVARLKTLEGLCLSLEKRALYFDGDDVVNDTQRLFAFLKRELGLNRDLSEEYPTYAHTGTYHLGDPSERIRKGRLDRERTDLSYIAPPECVIERAREAYARCRALLRERCTCP